MWWFRVEYISNVTRSLCVCPFVEVANAWSVTRTTFVMIVVMMPLHIRRSRLRRTRWRLWRRLPCSTPVTTRWTWVCSCRLSPCARCRIAPAWCAILLVARHVTIHVAHRWRLRSIRISSVTSRVVRCVISVVLWLRTTRICVASAMCALRVGTFSSTTVSWIVRCVRHMRAPSIRCTVDGSKTSETRMRLCVLRAGDEYGVEDVIAVS